MDDEMTESGKADVLVLDIRVSGEDSAWLDGLTLDNAHETDVADRVETVMASLPSLQISQKVALGEGGVIHGKRVKRFAVRDFQAPL